MNFISMVVRAENIPVNFRVSLSFADFSLHVDPIWKLITDLTKHSLIINFTYQSKFCSCLQLRYF